MWSKSSFNSFHLTASIGRMSGTVTVCALNGVSYYSVYCFALVRDWEHRVVLWLVKVWCCMLGEPVPFGLYWDALPQLDRLFRSTTGVGSFEIKPLVLSDLSRTILDVSGQVLGGTDMHVVLNHLQKHVKGFVKDPLLLSCPHLLQVRIILFAFRLSRLVFVLSSGPCCRVSVSFSNKTRLYVAILGYSLW